jgi:hypothetical protein
MSKLERELQALATHVDLPQAPDLTAAVRERLVRPARRPLRRRPLVIAIAAAVLALAAALAVPPARSALLDVLHLGGVEVRRVPELPATSPNARLAPGKPVSLSTARRRADFPIATPADCDFCDPVLFDGSIPGGRVTITWPGVRPRLFLMQFRGAATPFVDKMATARTAVRSVTVDGLAGYWIAGSPHAVVFTDEAGRTLFGRRLARNVLLWEDDGVTYRLEGDITLARALQVARSLRRP